jgi:hypothetical protein
METIHNRAPISSADTGALKVVAHYTLRALTWLIVATAMLVWLAIGFVFWIPLLVRAGIGFSVEVVNATLTGRSAVGAGIMLRRAVGFYRSGFVTAIEAIQEPQADRVRGERWRSDGPEDGDVAISPRGFLNEVGWTILIWYLIACGLGWTDWTPMRAVSELFSIEWSRHFRIIWYGFTAWLGDLSLS